MGSPPLAALAIQPPRELNMGDLANIMALKRAQALMPGQIQAQNLENEQRTHENQVRSIQLKNSQAMTAAMNQWDGKDMDALPELARKNGADANTVIGLKKNLIDQQQAMATLGKDQLANMSAVNDQLLGHIDTLKGITDPVQRAFQAKQTAGQILMSPLGKMLDPQTGQMIQGMAAGQFVPNDDQLGLFEKGLTAHQTQIKNALSAAQHNEAEQKGAEAAANAKKTTLENNYIQQYGGVTPAMAESRYLAVQTKMNQGIPVSPDDKAFVKSYEKNKTLSPVATFNLQNASNPAQQDNLAAAVANGSMKIGDVITYRTPLAQREAFLNKVLSINPQFNAGDFDIEKGVRKAFTTGKPAEELVAFNTALAHADLLKQASDALNNGDVRALNSLGNQLGVQFGSDKATNFQVIANAYSREVTKALSAGHLTDQEIKEQGGTIPANASPAQLNGAINAYRQLMASKVQQRQNQFNQGMKGKPNFGNQAQSVPPAAQGMVNVQLKDGRTGTIKADQLNKFLSDNPGSKQIQ